MHEVSGDDHAPTVIPQPYDRSALRPGVVHIGAGNFHRSHQAAYLDELLRTGHDPAWAVCAVGTTVADARVRDGLRSQDHLYTLALKQPDGTMPTRVIGSMCDYVFAPDEPDVLAQRLADPATRIVTLTVTEGGYDDPTAPTFRALAAALAARRAAGAEPFTIASCDNVQHNGRVARDAVVAAAGDALGAWIEANVAFPNSMVDRITPAATDADRERIRESSGHDDRVPVVAEPFVQWVLEDSFPSGRPSLEAVGVQLVTDVSAYEAMKLRLLNGAHQAIAYTGALQGHVFVHDAMRDPVVVDVVNAYWEAARPSVPATPGVDLGVYIAVLRERFENPHMADTVERLGSYASDRIPKFVLPVVLDNLAAGRPVDGLAAVVASWARCVELGIAPVDNRVVFGGTRLLEDPVFGELRSVTAFSDAFARAYASL